MKKCSRDSLCFNPNGGQDVLLFNSDFSKDSKQSRGLRNQCKYCDNKHQEKRRINNPNYSKEYYRDNKQTPIGRFRRIANKANTRCDSQITYKELICLFAAQNGYCPITNTKLNFKNMHLDHLKSISVGGGNDYDNLIFMKHVANTAKNGFGLRKFIHEMGELVTSEQKEVILMRIEHAHNRYEFMINTFLEMSNKELELTVQSILKST